MCAIPVISTQDSLTTRAERADKKAFKKILDQVPHRNPVSGDELLTRYELSNSTNYNDLEQCQMRTLSS